MRSPSRRQIAWTSVVFAASMFLVAAFGALIGSVGAARGFDWSLASVAGTAFGTTLLAAATGALALFTWRDVSATQELARLSREDQIARERPVLVPGPPSSRVSYIFKNVGTGAALNVGARILPESSAGEGFTVKQPGPPPVGAGDQCTLDFFGPDYEVVSEGQRKNIRVECEYHDLGGNRYRTATYFSPGAGWFDTDVAQWRDGEWQAL